MKLASWLKRAMIGSFSVLYFAGLSYWMSRSWFRVTGEFGEPRPHLFEKLAGPLHLAAALTFLFVLGNIWALHIRPSLHTKRHRRSGWLFLGVIGGLALSGVTLVYSGFESLNKLLELTHPVLGASLFPILALHWGFAARKKRRTARAPSVKHRAAGRAVHGAVVD